MPVLAFRPAPARPALVGALSGAARDGGLEWSSLGPLMRAEADRLLEKDLPQQARSALFAQSGGNHGAVPMLPIRDGGATFARPPGDGIEIDQKDPRFT